MTDYQRGEVSAGTEVEGGDVLHPGPRRVGGGARPDGGLHVLRAAKGIIGLGPLAQDEASPLGGGEVGAGGIHVVPGPPRRRAGVA